MGVYFRSKDGLMAKHLLNSPEISSSLYQVGGERVPECVRTHFFPYSGLQNEFLYHGKDHHPGKLVTSPVKKYIVFSGFDRILVIARLVEIHFNLMHGPLTYGYQSLLTALTSYLDKAVPEEQVSDTQIYQFAYP